MSDCKFKNVYVDMNGKSDDDVVDVFSMFIKAGASVDEDIEACQREVKTYPYLGVDFEGDILTTGCVVGTDTVVPFSEIKSYLGLASEDTTIPEYTWEDYDSQKAPPVGSVVTVKEGIAFLGGNTVEVVTKTIHGTGGECVVEFDDEHILCRTEYLLPSTPRKSVRERRLEYLDSVLLNTGYVSVEILDSLDEIK